MLRIRGSIKTRGASGTAPRHASYHRPNYKSAFHPQAPFVIAAAGDQYPDGELFLVSLGFLTDKPSATSIPTAMPMIIERATRAAIGIVTAMKRNLVSTGCVFWRTTMRPTRTNMKAAISLALTIPQSPFQSYPCLMASQKVRPCVTAFFQDLDIHYVCLRP